MILQVSDKEYNLRLKCRDVKKLKEKMQGENILEGITKAMQDSDVEIIAKCIMVMGGLKDGEAYDLIDTYLSEKENTFFTLCVKIMGVIDEAGFLPKRGMADQIAEGLQMTMDSLDLSKMMGAEMEKATKDIA